MRYLGPKDGFTLIELIVVISLISITLFFAIPRFRSTVLSDSTKLASRWLLAKTYTLKKKAVRNQRFYTLHVDIDSNKLWVSDESMSEEELENAVQTGYVLPDDIKLLDVEFPGNNKISGGQANIFFYKKGYSDKASIHIENDDSEQFTFLIEPFLSRAKLYEEYVGIEDFLEKLQ